MKDPLKRHLEMEALFGADFLPLSRSSRAVPSEARPVLTPPAPGPSGTPPEYEELLQRVKICNDCGLRPRATQAVFGVGPLGAPLMFVGEAPGEEEDRQGEPFVGRAGQLLTRTLKKIGVERSRVYIANILKYRPPDNRTPQFQEMVACMPHLLRQIQFVKPRLLCALGNISAQALLNTKTGITKLRGRYVEAHGVRIFPTFHPAYILRNMGEVGLFETDLRKVCRDAGLIG